MEQTTGIPGDAVKARPGLDGRIRRYWTRRSDAFGQVRREELQSDKSSLWRAEILPWLPRREDGTALRILDLGTGAGFFAILLAQAGCEVTGVDLSEGMLAQAAALADEAGCTVDWRCMSATELDFGDASFDGVLARNLTWTLPDPESAYREWMRVLKKGGILLNFDADYASNVRNQNTSASHISDTEVYGHCGVTPELEQENASITLSMPMSRKQRPYWDQEFLENIGFSRSGYDLSVGQNILKEHDLKDAPMFLVWGVR